MAPCLLIYWVSPAHNMVSGSFLAGGDLTQPYSSSLFRVNRNRFSFKEVSSEQILHGFQRGYTTGQTQRKKRIE